MSLTFHLVDWGKQTTLPNVGNLIPSVEEQKEGVLMDMDNSLVITIGVGGVEEKIR